MDMTVNASLPGTSDAARDDAVARFIATEKRAQQRRLIRNRLLAVGFGLLVIAIWHVATEYGFVHRLIIPSPIDTFWATGRVMSASYFWPNVGVTLSEIAWGFAFGLTSGVVFGVRAAKSL